MAGQVQEKKRVSIRQIAEALGVSSATVSLVLNGRARDYGLSEATEARVQLKAAEMGYSLVQSRRGSPGILIAGLGELYHVTPAEFVAPILDPLFEELIANGWHVMVSPYCRVGTYGVTPEMLAQSSAIVVPTRRAMEKQAHALVKQAAQLGVAALVLGPLHQDLDALFVDVDNYAGGQAVARHLYELGHRHVAVVMGREGEQHTEARLKGFCAFYAQRGAPVPAPMIWGYGQYMTTGGHAVTLDHIRQAGGPRPSAVFYMNDLMALGGCYAMREAGLRVPQDISIIGYDDDGAVRAMEPPLTSVGLEAGRLGYRLAHLLMDMARRGIAERMQVLCPPRLIVRKSTAQPPTEKEKRA